MGVYSFFCVHAGIKSRPALYVQDGGVQKAGIPPRFIAYIAEQEPATTDILPFCYSEDGCEKLKLIEKNSHMTISEYNGQRVPKQTTLSWNNTAFPNITKAMAGEYVCQNENGVALEGYQLNVVGK